MGGLLSKNSPGVPATAQAAQKKVSTEASATGTNDADVLVSAADETLIVEIKTPAESKPSVASTDEKAFEAVEAITVAETTASANDGESIDAESKDVEIVTSQAEILTEDGEKLIATDAVPDKPDTEVEIVAHNFPAESDQEQPVAAESTEVPTDVATELEKKLEELQLVSDAPQTDDQPVTIEEIEPQPTVVSSDAVEVAEEIIQESRDVDSASHTTDERDVAPSGADQQPAVDDFIQSDEIAVKQDSESCDGN